MNIDGTGGDYSEEIRLEELMISYVNHKYTRLVSLHLVLSLVLLDIEDGLAEVQKAVLILYQQRKQVCNFGLKPVIFESIISWR